MGAREGWESASRSWDSPWGRATRRQREIVLDIASRYRVFRPPDAMPSGAEAFASLTRTAGSGPYGLAQRAKLPPASPLLPRGAVCPAVVSEMAIPATEKLLDPQEFSPALASYCEHCTQHILQHPSLVD